MNDPIKLVPSRPDAEIAAELRAKMEAAWEPVCRVLDEARAAGFEISSAAEPDYAGRHRLTRLIIAKHFK
jgi:hypothetical protein